MDTSKLTKGNEIFRSKSQLITIEVVDESNGQPHIDIPAGSNSAVGSSAGVESLVNVDSSTGTNSFNSTPLTMRKSGTLNFNGGGGSNSRLGSGAKLNVVEDFLNNGLPSQSMSQSTLELDRKVKSIQAAQKMQAENKSKLNLEVEVGGNNASASAPGHGSLLERRGTISGNDNRRASYANSARSSFASTKQRSATFNKGSANVQTPMMVTDLTGKLLPAVDALFDKNSSVSSVNSNTTINSISISNNNGNNNGSNLLSTTGGGSKLTQAGAASSNSQSMMPNNSNNNNNSSRTFPPPTKSNSNANVPDLNAIRAAMAKKREEKIEAIIQATFYGPDSFYQRYLDSPSGQKRGVGTLTKKKKKNYNEEALSGVGGGAGGVGESAVGGGGGVGGAAVGGGGAGNSSGGSGPDSNNSGGNGANNLANLDKNSSPNALLLANANNGSNLNTGDGALNSSLDDAMFLLKQRNPRAWRAAQFRIYRDRMTGTYGVPDKGIQRRVAECILRNQEEIKSADRARAKQAQLESVKQAHNQAVSRVAPSISRQRIREKRMRMVDALVREMEAVIQGQPTALRAIKLETIVRDMKIIREARELQNQEENGGGGNNLIAPLNAPTANNPANKSNTVNNSQQLFLKKGPPTAAQRRGTLSTTAAPAAASLKPASSSASPSESGFSQLRRSRDIRKYYNEKDRIRLRKLLPSGDVY